MQRSSTTSSIHLLSALCSECSEVTTCRKCSNMNSLNLQHEIEELRARLLDSNNRMMHMESESSHTLQTVELENVKLNEELMRIRDRYDRLLDSHKRLQKCNDILETKLLVVVERYEEEKKELMDRIDALNTSQLDYRVTAFDLQEELERNQSDCNIAVQLLQCRPSNFISQKFSSLPVDVQQRVRSELSTSQLLNLDASDQAPISLPEIHCPQPPPPPKTRRIPMGTFPPTAFIYTSCEEEKPRLAEPSLGRSTPDTVPCDVMARVLSKPVLGGGTGSGRGRSRVFICARCMTEQCRADQGVQTDTGSPPRGVSVREDRAEERATVFQSRVHLLG